MNVARKIIASLFAHVAYGLLRFCGWKRKTVYANLRYVGAVGTACCENSREGAAAETTREETARGGASLRSADNLQGRLMGEAGDETACEKLYLELLHNLTRHVGELLFCFKTFKKLPADLGAYPCRVDCWDFDLAPGAAEVLEKMRRGGIFLTAHYGNYEAMGPWLCRLGIPLVASYIPVKPAWLNRILEGRIRAVDGRSYSVNARTPREFVRLLADGKLFCLLADQDGRIPSALAGEFMGRPVHNNPLPDFLLKHRPETPVFVCWVEERSTRILHAEQIQIQLGVSGSASVMARFNTWLQSRISENPALWYGFTHRRFYSKNPEMYK